MSKHWSYYPPQSYDIFEYYFILEDFFLLSDTYSVVSSLSRQDAT